MMPYSSDELVRHVEAIIRDNPRMITSFRPKLVSDEMWEYAIAMEPSLFPECKKKTYNIASIAISADGFHIGNIDPINYTGEQFSKLCELAVQQNPKSIVAIPKEFRTRNLLAYAYAREPELIMQEKKLTDDMIASIIDHNPSLIQHVVDPTEEIMIHALSKDPRVIVHFTTITPRVLEYFEENYPEYAAMILHQ